MIRIVIAGKTGKPCKHQQSNLVIRPKIRLIVAKLINVRNKTVNAILEYVVANRPVVIRPTNRKVATKTDKK